MTVFYAAMDIGNDSMKALISNRLSKPNPIYLPNVIARSEEDRNIISLEATAEEGLHCRITSGALENNGGIFTVGNLATRNNNNLEPEPGEEKSTSDQAVVMLLTTLALHAAKTLKKNHPLSIEVELSTGLPLREARRATVKEDFKKRLLGRMHEVEFLQTPEIGGQTVRIEFKSMDVYSEGQAAMMHLVTDEEGHIKNEELLHKSVLINDIGGLSTDSAVIERGVPDNTNSDGLRRGVAEALDTIIERVYDQYDHLIRSRRNLVRDVLLAGGERKNHVMVNGKLTSIQTIVDSVLHETAREQHIHLERMWKKVSDLELCFQIGGGSILLQKYLTDINEQSKQKFPLRWQDPEESVWMIARSYWKMLVLSQNESAAATKEG